MDFVDVGEINPMYFQKPYYLEPQKGGDKPYALLREALQNSGKIGIAKVVIRTPGTPGRRQSAGRRDYPRDHAFQR